VPSASIRFPWPNSFATSAPFCLKAQSAIADTGSGHSTQSCKPFFTSHFNCLFPYYPSSSSKLNTFLKNEAKSWFVEQEFVFRSSFSCGQIFLPLFWTFSYFAVLPTSDVAVTQTQQLGRLAFLNHVNLYHGDLS